MTAESLWVNGRFVAADEPIALATDHGLQMGDGVFDTIAIHGSRPMFLQRHLSRLCIGIDRLGIEGTPSKLELSSAIEAIIEANALVDARLRITVTAGPGPSPRERGSNSLTVITTAALTAPPNSVALCTVEWRRNERSSLAGIKSTSWGDNSMILRHARDRGFENALLCDSTGRLSECTTSNVFLVIDGRIFTPSLESGCLPGIIREVLIDCGLVSEIDLRPVDLERSTEVFITSSTTGVVPVRQVDATDFSTNGPRTSEARALIATQAARDS